MVSFSFLSIPYEVTSLCNLIWGDVLKSIVADPVMSKVEAHIIENGVFFRIRLKITQDFPFVRLPSTVSSFRASLLIMSVSLEPSTVSMEFSN